MEKFKLWGGRLLNIVIVVAIAFLVYQHFQKPPVISAPHSQVTTPSGLIKVTLDNKFKLSNYQAEQFSRQIRESEGKEPVEVVKATGSTWEDLAKKHAAKIKSDFSIVTDPKNPNQKPNPPKESTVNLNQYNLFAYPKTQAILGYSPNVEVIGAYQWKVVKAKSFQGYLGPYGRIDLQDGKKSSLGIMLTISGQ